METQTEDVTVGDRLAVVSRPAGAGRWPAVVMLHEVFGIDDVLRRQADRLASAGYLVVAPDLLGEGSRFGCMKRAFQALTARQGRPFEMISQARDWAAQQRECNGKVGVIGFCMGGGLVWQLLAAGEPQLAAAVPFYGPTPDDADFSGSKDVAVLAFYGSKDARVTGTKDAAQQALDKAGVVNELVVEQGADHAFFNDTGERYDPTAAVDAWQRVQAWFTKYVG
jgi:carboxymethylenebutenolidase